MVMRWDISRSVLIGIRQISAAAAPKEACGLLFGADGVIEAFQAVENVSETPERTFEIAPRALFAALKAERAGGPKIVGYFHSHPSGDPRPSVTDMEMAAADGKLWLIVTAGGMALWDPVKRETFMWGGANLHAQSTERALTRFRRVPLVTGDVQDLLPHTKSDEEMVPLLAEAGYPAVAPHLDDLLSWTYDSNWPIALPMGAWLAGLGAPIVEPLRRVLRGEDSDAKVDCLWCVADHLTPDARAALAGDLWALATSPGEGDRAASVDICAREVLAEWGLAR